MKIKFSASYGMFARPEARIEAVSYPIPTPSAITGMLEAIFWKPEMRYKLHQIILLSELKYITMRRNMLKSKCDPNTAQEGNVQIIETDRTQRSHEYLKDPCFIVDFDIIADNVPKYEAQLTRRVEKGRSFSDVFMGTRECVADFCFPTGDEQPHPSLIGIQDHGMVLDKTDYIPDPQGEIIRKVDGKMTAFSPKPIMFLARGKDGVFQCP